MIMIHLVRRHAPLENFDVYMHAQRSILVHPSNMNVPTVHISTFNILNTQH